MFGRRIAKGLPKLGIVLQRLLASLPDPQFAQHQAHDILIVRNSLGLITMALCTASTAFCNCFCVRYAVAISKYTVSDDGLISNALVHAVSFGRVFLAIVEWKKMWILIVAQWASYHTPSFVETVSKRGTNAFPTPERVRDIALGAQNNCFF
jgi:hypothetical protein